MPTAPHKGVPRSGSHGEKPSGPDDVHPGAREIVRQYLGLEPGQDLVIFCDETTLGPATALSEAAESLDVPPSMILVPVALQRRIPHLRDLSLLVQGAAQQARAILTCVTAAPDCLAFRERVLETQWSARTRIGHMPGATLDVLDMATADLAQIVNDCHCLEMMLARGRVLELVSYLPGGEELRLTASLGGWDRLPVASDGVITDGAWGNVPSGETYIAPMEGTAEGSVAINGSMPGRVLGSDDTLVLRFSAGRLVQIEPSDGRAARWLDESQIRRAKDHGDLNWSNLGEIGIGTNAAARRLSGNMLYDEKAAGTAHVALGSNTFMGGRVASAIHCDLVTLRPTIRIDGRTVLDRGALRFVEREWRESYTRVRLHTGPLEDATEVARSGAQVLSRQPADRSTLSPSSRGLGPSPSLGLLQRVLRPGPGRVSSCFVGDDTTARLADRLYAATPAAGDWIAIPELASRANLDAETARRVLHVMWDYGIVSVR